jgi:GT2 family glycosyltransferase
VAEVHRTDLQAGISVVVPVRNDPEGVVALLEALAAQTRQPDEVIIVNDGSTDETRRVLEARRAAPLDYRSVDTAAVGTASARNLGISHATHEWIACTDAGCVPVREWLEAIEGASGDADFVAGAVIIDAPTPLERLFAVGTFPRPNELDHPSPLVRASHRLFGRGMSAARTGGGYMAFRRAVWESVGGFPLGLSSSEDRVFSAAVARSGFRVTSAPRAAVHWRPRTSLPAYLAMFFSYSRGDVRVRPRTRHLVRTCAYAGVAIGWLRGGPLARKAMAGGGLAYLWLPFHRARQDRLAARYWWGIPAVIMLKDLVQIAGAGVGLLDALRSRFTHGEWPGRRRLRPGSRARARR